MRRFVDLMGQFSKPRFGSPSPLHQLLQMYRDNKLAEFGLPFETSRKRRSRKS
jgi:hypothetical protein